MLQKLFLAVVMVCAFAASACADDFDLGLRFSHMVDTNVEGNGYEVAFRYFPPLPVKVLSLGASVGENRMEYDKGTYTKKVETFPLGVFANLHLPSLFIKPYAGFGALIYNSHDIRSPNPSDTDSERNSTTTWQCGADISLPVPKASLNIELRRLVDDHATMAFGGFWLKF